jgi:hypothetical protein
LPADYGFVSGPTVSFGELLQTQVNAVGVPVQAVDEELVNIPYTTPPTLMTSGTGGSCFVASDAQRPPGGQNVLSGVPSFNGPLTVVFSAAVSNVNILVGFLNDFNGVRMTTYDASMNVIDNQLSTVVGGFQTMIAAVSGIRAVQIHKRTSSSETAGFGIDDITFEP